MDLQYIRRLIKIVNESQIAEIEIEEDGKRVRVTRNATIQQAAAATPLLHHTVQAAEPVSPTSAVTATTTDTPSPTSYHEVRSPIVGTFYRSSSPEAEPFVKAGQAITVGSTLCIIEAMKIMNEIESEVSGRIVKVLVENGQPVEYNQALFLIDPS